MIFHVNVAELQEILMQATRELSLKGNTARTKHALDTKLESATCSYIICNKLFTNV